MPRPGPRPYECVRRAWHSDRHQPMRGSLIQEIFRVVSEIHSSATRKNKEWQEKLPIVVLKVEEIMYSKANSEDDYMDLKTLWDRANDAINTIIRRDETTETGAFLQPCIEAALNLGCTPRRASRSQRNDTPSYYFSPSSPEPICAPSRTQGNHTNNSPFISHYLDFMKPTTTKSIHFGLEPHNPVVQNNIRTINKSSLSPVTFSPSGSSHCSCLNTCSSDEHNKLKLKTNSSSVYPLYYGDYFQSKESEFSFSTPSKLNSDSIEPSEMGFKPKLSSCNVVASNKITRENFRNTPENAPGIVCDLSLRLGSLVVPCISIESSWPQEVEDIGSSDSRGGSKWKDSSLQMDKEFSFFPKATADDPLDSCSVKLSSETQNMKSEKTARKRKAVLSHLSEDEQFLWLPKLSFNHFTGRMSNAGS